MFCKQRSLIYLIVGLFFLISCTPTKTLQKTENKIAVVDNIKTNESRLTSPFLEDLLKQYPQYFDSVLKNRKAWNVQIIYTQVNRGKNGIPALQQFYFNVDDSKYFYPASTVKLPVTMLALQRLNELKQNGIDKNTTMVTEAANNSQTAVYNDPTTPDGKPNIAQYIKKILMVSDNDAFNRLYEFLGQDYINDQLHKKGYADAQILHHLNIFLSEEENRQTNPIKFLDSTNKILYDQKAQRSNMNFDSRKDFLGKGYYSGNQLINEPMNFSKKNRISLQDLHNILISLVFPEKVHSYQRFNLTDDDRKFMLKYMSQYPTESVYPPYSDDTAHYWPTFGKFLLFGAEKRKMPENIRIFNKIGDAYGQMIDVAYVVDFKNKIEFFLSAAIYCNSDGILNDDKYDYDTIGLPFMKNLGQVIYDYELKKDRKRLPDLSSLIFKYDK